MKKKLLSGLFVSLIVAALCAPLASPNPDALERVLIKQSKLSSTSIAKFSTNVLWAPFADYQFPGINNQALATGTAGVTGTLFTFGSMYLLVKFLGKNGKIE